MLLYWKFLLVLGTILWGALYFSDFIYSKDIDYKSYVCEVAPVEPEIVDELNWLVSFLYRLVDFDTNLSFYGDIYIIWLLQWVAVTILFTAIFYTMGKVTSNLIASYLIRGRVFSNLPTITIGPQELDINPTQTSKQTPASQTHQIFELDSKTSNPILSKTNSISRIPLLVTRHEAQSPFNAQDGSSVIADCSNVQCTDDIFKSCPNLSPKSSAIKNKILFSLYDNDRTNNIKSSKSVDRLRDEIVTLQATSFREQAILSRKLDAIVREKRDLSVALTNSLKENKTAKRKLEDIQKERAVLIKQLECATNEIKSNTKSKKLTLTRLEKAIDDSKAMKNDFARLNDEKKLLEEKVISLDRECSEMKARRNVLNQSYSEIKQGYEGDSVIHDKTDEDSLTSGGYYEVTDKQLYQSSIDMNKVQTKLNDLERSLEKLKFSSTITKERERSLQEGITDNILNVDISMHEGNNYDRMNENKIDEDDDVEESTESQNANYNQGDATAVTSLSSLDIDDCQSLCLVPGCSREHNICINPTCVYEHAAEEELIPKKGYHSPERNADVNRVTSTNQIILEAVKEKSKVLANRSSLFDTREARARLAAFFSVSLWKRKENEAISTLSDDRLSVNSDSQKTEFEYEEWSPRLVPPGIVSQSPAFQKFLSNIIVDQQNELMKQTKIRTG